jgi:hypothetical protein
MGFAETDVSEFLKKEIPRSSTPGSRSSPEGSHRTIGRKKREVTMTESDIRNIEAGEHHAKPHAAATSEAHSEGIARHDPESAHEINERIHHESQTETKDSNGGDK